VTPRRARAARRAVLEEIALVAADLRKRGYRYRLGRLQMARALDVLRVIDEALAQGDDHDRDACHVCATIAEETP
jgi:hypothetical protein